MIEKNLNTNLDLLGNLLIKGSNQAALYETILG